MSDEIQRALGRVEGKLDSLIATMKDHLADDSRNFSKAHARIWRVEPKVYGAADVLRAIESERPSCRATKRW